jgi:carbonic anhydrase/acetyltransferase-like protein (isoleucine patch superfamily)
MTKKSNKSIRSNPNGDIPVIDDTAYVDPTAQVIGNVKIGSNVYVGPYAVIRADECDDQGQVHAIEIDDECNVQDGVIIHALGGTKVTIGKRSALAHGCIVHGPCAIGSGCFIGFRAVVYKAALGNGSFIGASAVIQGIDLADNTLVTPGDAILSETDVGQKTGTAGDAEKEFTTKVLNANITLTKGYKKQTD